MSTAHLVGYVGGLAVAVGVGTAVWLGAAPTASADTSSATSSHGPSSGKASSARPRAQARRVKQPTTRVLRSVAAAQDVLSGEYDPVTGKVTTSFDGKRAFIATGYHDADNNPNTLVAEIDTTTGTQIGDTVPLFGTLSNLAFSAKDTRAIVTTTWGSPDTGGSLVAVFDSATGRFIAGSFLNGKVSNVVPSADGNHVLITTSDPWIPGYPGTSAVVIDTITGVATGPIMKFRGDGNWTPPLLLSDNADTALIITLATGVGTVVRVVDTTTGYLTGSEVNILGYANGPAIMAGDGIHVLISTTDYNSGTENAVLTVIDTATSSQTGTSLWVHGKAYSAPMLTPDGKHAVIVTTVKDSENVSTTTRFGVLDTTTGIQVGTSRSLMGGVSDTRPPTVGAHGVVIRTTAGLQTTVDPVTGVARTVPVAFPWGFDMEALTRTITNIPAVQAVGGFLLSAGLVGSIVLGVVLSYAVYVGQMISYYFGLPPIAAATP